ncbi:dopamine D2-like receptor [Pecten maximus]|uniref:dopamine D2-like receptor n=1 Tax=Pecten maximus TaxID=6579 RepID=UPI0014583F4B|nr:dopamine D2-like receptor [Pecten maximus]
MAEYTPALEFFDRQHDQQNLLLVSVVTLICIFGLIGNFHVVLVYTCRLKTKTTFKGCIVWLAVLDLLNCITVMPMDVTYFMHPYSVYNSTGCKMKHYLGQLVTFSAVAVTLVIAIDRYRKVCKPTYRQIRYREGRLLCGILVLVLALALTPVPVMMGMEDVEIVSFNVTLHKCGIDQSYKDSVVPKIVIYFFVCVLYVASTAVIGIYFQLGKYLRQRNSKLFIPAAIRRRISRKETFSKADLLKMKADPSFHPSPSPTSTSSDESNFVSENQPRSVFHTRNSDHLEYQFDVSDRKYSVSDIDSGMATCSQTSRDRREIANARKRKDAVTSIASMPDDVYPDNYETGEFVISKINDENKDEENHYMTSDEFHRSGEDISGLHLGVHSDTSQSYHATEKYSEEITTLTRNQITRKPQVDLTGSCKSSKRLLGTLDSNFDASNYQTTSTEQSEHRSENKRVCNSVFYNRISSNVNHDVFLSEKRERRQQRNNTVVKMCYIIAIVCLLCLLPATITFLLTFANIDKSKFGYVFVRLGHRSPYLRSCLNPFIYGFLDTKFRRACVDLYAIFAQKVCGRSIRPNRHLSHRSTYRTHYTLNNMVHVVN